MNPRPTGPKPVALPNCATPRYELCKIGRGRRIRTLDTRFWRPLLYQLSYTPSLIFIHGIAAVNKVAEKARFELARP